ncbi:unnamed protein product [Lasius platythorax]|uniref:Uncharacterized protein n=1 Tax=Lasius platythorax TaxID=488582 RepID=A0AAV2MZE7_9HYME
MTQHETKKPNVEKKSKTREIEITKKIEEREELEKRIKLKEALRDEMKKKIEQFLEKARKMSKDKAERKNGTTVKNNVETITGEKPKEILNDEKIKETTANETRKDTEKNPYERRRSDNTGRLSLRRSKMEGGETQRPKIQKKIKINDPELNADEEKIKISTNATERTTREKITGLEGGENRSRNDNANRMKKQENKNHEIKTQEERKDEVDRITRELKSREEKTVKIMCRFTKSSNLAQLAIPKEITIKETKSLTTNGEERKDHREEKINKEKKDPTPIQKTSLIKKTDDKTANKINEETDETSSGAK